MQFFITKIKDLNVEVYNLNTIVVGSGAAGFNAADRLYNYGQKDIAIVTEGINQGTSRNTGSDKQTYYKLTLAGEENDSVLEMAKTFFAGGSMDGDIALTEAALSAQSFYHLVDIGVPFPHNRFGEYVGYKTDHDPRQRATSAGPLTSKLMTENLEEVVKEKNIKIFDGYQVISVLTDENKEKVIGILALNLNNLEDKNKRYTLFNCKNVIYATGGPAGMYATSVYPDSQTGATGIALEAGAMGKNLTESQYGIASIKFRWNLSGTYQQVLPRYVSTDQSGNDERKFLEEYFEDPGKMLDAIFLKGYQWPFDPKKVHDYASSIIDILVYNETVIKGRRVWLDFMKNPSWGSDEEGNLDFSILGQETYEYLDNSNSLFGTPIERLAKMNQPAIDLYQDNGIDITKEYLEIAVCAQHNNGGLHANLWWESNLKNFFPVGEVNGSHGVYRPGGSALNSGQVGSTRAAQYITANYQGDPLELEEFLDSAKAEIVKKVNLGEKLANNLSDSSNVLEIKTKIGQRMSKIGAHIRSLKSAERGIRDSKNDLDNLFKNSELSSLRELSLAFQNYDMLITQYVYLSAIKDYIEKGGISRGSYLIYDSDGELPIDDLDEKFRFKAGNDQLNNKIQRVLYEGNSCEFNWDQVKEIPQDDNWFENVWNKYMKGKIIK
ncbi:Succinate dehydrogenase/fumarate reductase, flavoprotein subunit [Halanaerobium congolense]|uniref:Succinate dehydrogenase/fumarate reductase, flavoprotein subunit n=1 Tax=Halanaerobium congolense TaxID=54121 RepID=A0A1G6KCG7_9FIRM|nr:FAD-binding protein [Halanaerobium congolense]PTX17655.1 succinate dehydrogenase/fumarate reductase flavoprotein subunit [Halanaerobium congolense]SDC28653.1 Succinate dehydrogenase/fumarate reductase, flavoprotein subunit [Halanaerobium congolense]SDF66781.1 Succinate dehydrogenase/fumarate reductase, flavoprotein subunit [Halanaerobium congolense]SET03014.1 Succinate dehydrogenase/fumarate reductase, flavoprotein subunit [Halanaerobium congolense]SFP40421.1 Succinate dehydrogenase/fumarat